MFPNLPAKCASASPARSVCRLLPTRLHVAGLTEMQAEQMIADVLQANGLVSHPEVGVLVKEHRSRPITMVGAVVHPMVYQADHTVTLLEVLAEAGGISNDAGDTIIVTRAHSPTFVMVPNPEPIVEPPGAAPSSTDNSAAPATNGHRREACSRFRDISFGNRNGASSADVFGNSFGRFRGDCFSLREHYHHQFE